MKPALFILLVVFGLACGTVQSARANDPVISNDSGLSLLEKGDYDQAIEQLSKAYDIFSSDVAIRRNLSYAWAMKGRKLMEEKRFDEAAAAYEHAREVDPEELRFGLMRGIALYFARKLESAKLELEQAATPDSRSLEAWYYLGMVCYDSGELVQALAAWEKAQVIAPDNKSITELIEKTRRELAIESRMGRERGGEFDVSYDAEVPANLASAVLDELETAYNRVGSDLSHYPAARLPVILYTRKDFKDVTAVPDWSGGLYDGKIRLPIGGVTEMMPHLQAILHHEYTHALIHDLTRGSCPVWLNEGIAEFEGRRYFDPSLVALPEHAAKGTLIPFDKLEGSFVKLKGDELHLAYEQSYSFVRFMVTSYGWHKMRDLLDNLAKGLPVAEAFDKAFADYGLKFDNAGSSWRSALGKEFPGRE